MAGVVGGGAMMGNWGFGHGGLAAEICESVKSVADTDQSVEEGDHWPGRRWWWNRWLLSHWPSLNAVKSLVLMRKVVSASSCCNIRLSCPPPLPSPPPTEEFFHLQFLSSFPADPMVNEAYSDAQVLVHFGIKLATVNTIFLSTVISNQCAARVTACFIAVVYRSVCLVHSRQCITISLPWATGPNIISIWYSRI
jgi:hypothetical protein